MIDHDKTICICNGVTVQELADSIKKNGLETVEEIVANDECHVGNKCESCIEDGYENDGCSLAMVLSLVKQGRL